MKRAPIRGSCLLLSLLLIGGSAAAAPSLSKRYTHYTLTSSSLAGLEAEMARRGPRISGSGERHPGATRVEIKASVDYTAGSGRCSVSKVRVSVDARITLPRWKPRRMPSSEEQLLWTTLAADIKRHEERHVGIAMNHARELEQAIGQAEGSRDCTRLEARVERLTGQILEKHRLAQDRFDRIERINFEDRFDRLLNYRLQKIEKKKKSR